MNNPKNTPKIVDYYQGYDEAGRLFRAGGRLERARTQEIIRRYLGAGVHEVIDIGGGPGVYAVWLAAQGLEVHLVDLAPKHIELARERAQAEGVTLASARVGNALDLDVPAERFDMALLLGPLYHLQRRAARLRALAEMWRVLRPGGLAFCAAISRYASLFDGYYYRMIEDLEFRAIIARDLATGEHVNPTEKDYFTDAYFHTPAELEAEIAEAGYEIVGTMGVEGFGRLLPDFDAIWADADRRRRLLDYLREIERAPSLLGMSAHLLAVARRPG